MEWRRFGQHLRRCRRAGNEWRRSRRTHKVRDRRQLERLEYPALGKHVSQAFDAHCGKGQVEVLQRAPAFPRQRGDGLVADEQALPQVHLLQALQLPEEICYCSIRDLCVTRQVEDPEQPAVWQPAQELRRHAVAKRQAEGRRPLVQEHPRQCWLGQATACGGRVLVTLCKALHDHREEPVADLLGQSGDRVPKRVELLGRGLGRRSACSLGGIPSKLPDIGVESWSLRLTGEEERFEEAFGCHSECSFLERADIPSSPRRVSPG